MPGLGALLPTLNGHPLCRLYSAKLAQYRKRVWTCAATQAGELTFEEALASEAAGEKLVPEARCCAFPQLTSSSMISTYNGFIMQMLVCRAETGMLGPRLSS